MARGASLLSKLPEEKAVSLEKFFLSGEVVFSLDRPVLGI